MVITSERVEKRQALLGSLLESRRIQISDLAAVAFSNQVKRHRARQPDGSYSETSYYLAEPKRAAVSFTNTVEHNAIYAFDIGDLDALALTDSQRSYLETLRLLRSRPAKGSAHFTVRDYREQWTKLSHQVTRRGGHYKGLGDLLTPMLTHKLGDVTPSQRHLEWIARELVAVNPALAEYGPSALVTWLREVIAEGADILERLSLGDSTALWWLGDPEDAPVDD